MEVDTYTFAKERNILGEDGWAGGVVGETEGEAFAGKDTVYASENTGSGLEYNSGA